MLAGGILMTDSNLKVEKCNEPADLQRLTTLPVRINYLSVCVAAEKSAKYMHWLTKFFYIKCIVVWF
jgi:hypothetical protein